AGRARRRAHRQPRWSVGAGGRRRSRDVRPRPRGRGACGDARFPAGALRDATPPHRGRAPRRRTMSGIEQVAVAVIGAGPYGLAIAAHLKGLGVPLALFGAPLARWAAQLPPGFMLRSPAEASSIAGPRGGPACSVADFRSSL